MPGMLMSETSRMIFSPRASSNIANAAQGQECEVEHVKRLAHLSTELLSEQRLDMRLVIDNQHPYASWQGSAQHLTPRLGFGSRPVPLAGQDHNVPVASRSGVSRRPMARPGTG